MTFATLVVTALILGPVIGLCWLMNAILRRGDPGVISEDWEMNMHQRRSIEKNNQSVG